MLGVEPLELRAGPLTMLYEAGDLRYVRLGELELVRRIYFAARDRNWGTAPTEFSRPQLDQRADGFTLTFDAVSRLRDLDFAWTGQISGNADGTVTFAFEGTARTTFLRNRLGLLVLHPGQLCAGQPARVTQPDGQVVDTAFPTLIAPRPPFTDIAAFAHEAAPGFWPTLRFTGEVFETEDQRNWTDASFKTYSGLTRLPMPVEVPAGTRLAQSVTLTLEGTPPTAISAAADPRPVVSLGAEPVAALPPLGVSAASHGQPLSASEMERLRALPLSHLRVDVHPAATGWAADLRRVAAEAAALDLALEVALHLPAAPDDALAAVAAEIQALQPRVARWLVYGLGAETPTAAALTAARQHLAGAPIVGGTDAFFAQLNGARPPLELVDGVGYSINPQGHAWDTRTIMETFEAQPVTVATARSWAAGKQVVISPITLRMRANPAAIQPDLPPAPGERPPQVDLRQLQNAGAAWTVGSLAALAPAGADSLTFYETTGWRGLMETAAGSPDAVAFPSQPGQLFPLYHVFAALAAWRGAAVLPLTVTGSLAAGLPLAAAGLALRRGDAHTALIANLTGQPSVVRVRGVAPAADLKPVAGDSTARAAEAGQLELTLGPFAVAQLVW